MPCAKSLAEYLLKAPWVNVEWERGKGGGVVEAFQMLSLPTVLPEDRPAFLGSSL